MEVLLWQENSMTGADEEYLEPDPVTDSSSFTAVDVISKTGTTVGVASSSNLSNSAGPSEPKKKKPKKIQEEKKVRAKK
jgi:hypothetical protein